MDESEWLQAGPFLIGIAILWMSVPVQSFLVGRFRELVAAHFVGTRGTSNQTAIKPHADQYPERMNQRLDYSMDFLTFASSGVAVLGGLLTLMLSGAAPSSLNALGFTLALCAFLAILFLLLGMAPGRYDALAIGLRGRRLSFVTWFLTLVNLLGVIWGILW